MKDTYLRTKGTDNLEESGPKISDSCDILRITLLTISPKYIPDIIFSKPCSKVLKDWSKPFNYYLITELKTGPYHIIWIRTTSI